MCKKQQDVQKTIRCTKKEKRFYLLAEPNQTVIDVQRTDSMTDEWNCFSSSCGRLNFLSWRRKNNLCWAWVDVSVPLQVLRDDGSQEPEWLHCSHSAVHDGEWGESRGVSPEVHGHLHSFERVKLQVVKTAPDRQLLNLLSVSRLVSVLLLVRMFFREGRQYGLPYVIKYFMFYIKHLKKLLMISETRMDRENKLWRYAAVRPKRHNKFNLIVSGSPYRLALAKAMLDKLPWEECCSGTLLLPPLLQTLLPSPDQLPLYRFVPPPVEQVCDQRRNKWRRTGRLLARAGYVPLLQVMCLWYMCFCAEVFFFCSHTVLPNGA